MKIICTSHILGHPEIVSTLLDCYIPFSLLENDKSSFKLSFDRDNFVQLLNISFGNNIIAEQLKRRFKIAEIISTLRNTFRRDDFEDKCLSEISKDGFFFSELFDKDLYLKELSDQESLSYQYIKRNLDIFNAQDLTKVFLIFKEVIEQHIDSNKRWDDYKPQAFQFSDGNITITDYFSINGEVLVDVKKQVRDYVLEKLPYFLNDLEKKEAKLLEIKSLLNDLNSMINNPDDEKLFPVVLKINQLFYAY